MSQTTPDAQVLSRLQPPRSRRWLWLGGGGILLVLACGGLAVGSQRAAGTSRWETATVEQGDLVLGVTAVGVLEPTHTATVGSDQSGTVADVLVSENDPVTEGQVLAELEPDSLDLLVEQGQTRVAQGEATLEQARITAQEARKEAERMARMLEQGAASAYEADLARVAAEKADAALEMARAQARDARLALDLARHNRAEATLRSPLTGTVLTRNVEKGQSVVSALQAATLFEIAADLHQMDLPVEVDEAEVGRVQEGQAATFTVPAWVGRSFDATVQKVHIAPKKGLQVVSYIAELRVENPDGALRPGMTATARIVTDTLEGALLVPSEALRFDPAEPAAPEGPHLWIVEEGKIQPLPVEVAGNDGTHAAVKGEGLAVGTTVALRETGPRKFTPPGAKKEAR